jgi:hypothetical protein
MSGKFFPRLFGGRKESREPAFDPEATNILDREELKTSLTSHSMPGASRGFGGVE